MEHRGSNKSMEIKSKRAQIFTFVAVALILVFFTLYGVYSFSPDRQAIKTRISTMDNFLFSMEQNLEREIYIFGYRAIFLAEDYIVRTGNYIPNMQSFIDEAFFNGTVAGKSTEILVGVRYTDIISSANEKASKINVNFNISSANISIKQVDPWNVEVIFSFRLNMSDKMNLASWNKNEIIKTRISIEGFEDPLYIVNTNGKVSYKINRTIYEGIYVLDGNPANLSNHLNSRLYTENSDAPNFLKRFEGNLSADENGIESLVDLGAFFNQDLPVYQRSAVDHVYFSGNSTANYRVRNMPYWFMLDSYHLAKYNATDLAF